eukprot:CAMPEP_0171491512 /NCGR_PEP_ID=MMETSP0958-20121227/3899_1 /TAXON_ID=87120 /ORGANISM="Aurantiochytrium limacinum, Strain ATCCMYA-1381" /LENGTH=34 /DNA_ID= /DNA_START= /DNA_END= /DNA_ORIENTATION=
MDAGSRAAQELRARTWARRDPSDPAPKALREHIT